MQEQPENSKNPRPTTKGDYQGTSVVIDPKTANLDNEGERQDENPQQNASSAKPRSMPWPEVPTTQSSTRKKKTPRPTKPSLDDEWLAEFQEPGPAFPSKDFRPEPANAPLRRTTNAQSKNKKPASASASSTLENEWIAISNRPPQTPTGERSQYTPQPPVSESSSVPAEAAVPNLEPVIPTSPNSIKSASHDAGIDTPPTASATMTGAEWQDHNKTDAPGSPSYAPVSVPLPPEPPAPSLPPSPLAPPPTQPTAVEPVPPTSPYETSRVPQAALDAVPGKTPILRTIMPPPPGVTEPDAVSPSPDQEEAAVLSEKHQGSAPGTPSYAPVSIPPPPEPPAPFRSLSQVTPAPEATEMTPPESPFDSEIQALMRAPSPNKTPTSFEPPLASPTPLPIPPPPGLDTQTAGTVGEQKKAGTPPPTDPSPQSAKPMAFEPTHETVPVHPSPAPSAPPAHNAASPSLDEEWVASLNEVQEELPSTIFSPHAAGSTAQARNALGDPQQPNKYDPPNDWLPIDRQQSPSTNGSTGLSHIDSDASERQAPSPENSGQQGSIAPQPETPEDFISSGKTSVSHVVQAWPSTRSGRATTKSHSTHSTLEGESSDSLEAGSDVTFAMDSGGLEHDQSGEEGYGPLRLRHPSFTGDGSTLFGIFTTNTVWTLLTFGIYSFWGRVNIRRYLCSQTKFAGARFAFHGTGGELLLGWLKALLALGIPYVGLNYISSHHTEAIWRWSLNGLTGVLVASLIPMAIVGSHRYRMSRTSWRGIRFSFRRSIPAFTILYLKGVLLSLVTLGLYYPVFEHARRAFLTSGTHFGNQAFGFDGDPKVLGQLYFKAIRRLVLTLVTAEVFLLATWFLARQIHPKQVIDLVFLASAGTGTIVIPILLGLWFWFQAAKQRYMWDNTTFGSSRFRATMKGRHLFELKSTNLILLVGSLGLAWPWVQKRNLQFQYYHVGFRGPLRLQHIMQQASSASPMGEELAGFFDAGFEM